MKSFSILRVVVLAAVAGVNVAHGQSGPKPGWHDSYSIGGKCYCDTTFDHNIGGVTIPGTGGMTAREACARAGEGPESNGDEMRLYYNDIQCGNGPPNDAGDEDWCPGRVDLGTNNKSGCNDIGPKFSFNKDPSSEEPFVEEPEEEEAPGPEPEEEEEEEAPVPESEEEDAPAPEPEEEPAEEPAEEPEEEPDADLAPMQAELREEAPMPAPRRREASMAAEATPEPGAKTEEENPWLKGWKAWWGQWNSQASSGGSRRLLHA